MATKTTGNIRSTEGEGGCNGPIINGRNKSTAATTINITIYQHPNHTLPSLIKASLSQNLTKINRGYNVNNKKLNKTIWLRCMYI